MDFIETHRNAQTTPRVVCPKAFTIEYDNAKEDAPFWMAQPQLVMELRSTKPRPPYDVSVVTHLNADRCDHKTHMQQTCNPHNLIRLHALHVQCRFWAGTISAALYLPFLNGKHLHNDDPDKVQEYSRQVLSGATEQDKVEEKLRLWYQHHMEVWPPRLCLSTGTPQPGTDKRVAMPPGPQCVCRAHSRCIRMVNLPQQRHAQPRTGHDQH